MVKLAQAGDDIAVVFDSGEDLAAIEEEIAVELERYQARVKQWEDRWPKGYRKCEVPTGTVLVDPVSGSEFVRLPHDWIMVKGLGLKHPFSMGQNLPAGQPEIFPEAMLDPALVKQVVPGDRVDLAICFAELPEPAEALDRCCRAINHYLDSLDNR